MFIELEVLKFRKKLSHNLISPLTKCLKVTIYSLASPWKEIFLKNTHLFLEVLEQIFSKIHVYSLGSHWKKTFLRFRIYSGESPWKTFFQCKKQSFGCPCKTLQKINLYKNPDLKPWMSLKWYYLEIHVSSPWNYLLKKSTLVVVEKYF